MIEVAAVLYLCVMAVATRILTDHFAYQLMEGTKDRYPGGYGNLARPLGDHWVFGFLLALFASALWPLVLAWQIKVPAVGAAARARAVQQAERIRELEREAGL